MSALHSRESLEQAIMLLLISRSSEPISTNRSGAVRLLTSEIVVSRRAPNRIGANAFPNIASLAGLCSGVPMVSRCCVSVVGWW